jgi:hypothetical protein
MKRERASAVRAMTMMMRVAGEEKGEGVMVPRLLY